MEKSKRIVLDVNIDYWLNKYYQLANRLVFFHRLQNMHLSTFKGIRLLLIYFTNDYTHIQTPYEKMIIGINEMFKNTTGTSFAPAGVIELFIDVSDL